MGLEAPPSVWPFLPLPGDLKVSARKELDSVLGTARAQIFGSDTQTLVDGAVGSATTLMEGLVKGNQTSTPNSWM